MTSAEKKAKAVIRETLAGQKWMPVAIVADLVSDIERMRKSIQRLRVRLRAAERKAKQ